MVSDGSSRAPKEYVQTSSLKHLLYNNHSNSPNSLGGKTHPTLHSLRPSTLIHLHRIDQPIRILERTRVILHIRFTSRRLTPTAALSPDILIASPLSAECCIKDNLHVLKMAVDITMTRSTAEMTHRCAPLRRIWGTGQDVSGDLCTREEPDGDSLVSPFRGIDAAASGVEAGAVGGGVGAHVSASGILLLTWGVAVAICSVGMGEGAGVPDRAASVGVQRHLICRGCVDAFDDVDFAAHRPGAATEEPECGPCPAADGHVGDVCHEQAFVEGFVARDSNASSAGGILGRGIDADVAGVAVVDDGAY